MADINFGILDTQMPGRIAAIPQQQQAQQAQNAMQLMQVQQTMQQNALAKAKMEEYTRGLNEKNTLNQIYNQYYGGQGVSPAGGVAGDASVNGLISSPGMPAGAPGIPSAELARRGLGHMIPAFEEQQLKITKERGAISAQQAKADADRTTAAANKTKALGTGLLSVKDNPTDEALISAFDRMDSTGIDTKPFRAEFAKVTDLNERKKIINNYALTNPEARAALSFVEPKWEKFDLNGKIIAVDTNSNSPTYKQQIMEQAKTLTPYEIGRLKNANARLAQETATGKFTPDTVDFLAQTYIQTGNIPPLGMGRAAADLRQKVIERAAIMARTPATAAPGEAAPAPVSAADAARIIGQNKQAFAGGTAGQRTLGTTLANVTSAATEANNMIPLVEKYAALVNPTDFPLVNAAGNFVSRQGGGENVVGLAGSLNSLVNAYARAINPKGVATVSDKNHAREIINEAMSKGQLNTALSVMRAEMESAMAAPVQVQEKMRGGGKSQAPAAAATTPKAAPASGAIQDGYRFKGGDPAKASNWEKVGG